MDFDAYVPKPRPLARPRWSWSRTAAIAVALVVHAALGLRVLLPATEADVLPRQSAAEERSPMALVLLETPAPTATPEPVSPTTPRNRTQAMPERRPEPAMTAVFPEPATDAPAPAPTMPPTAARLEAQLPDLARSIAGQAVSRANGTLPALPGRAVAVLPLHAPVKRWKQITPERIGTVLAAMFVGTMAANPDDFEKARDLRDPLREMTEAHLQSFNEPRCDDPADPLRDRRCWDDNPNLRR